MAKTKDQARKRNRNRIAVRKRIAVTETVAKTETSSEWSCQKGKWIGERQGVCEQTSKQANKQSNDKRMPSGKGRPKAFQPQFGKFYYDNKSKPGECEGESLAIDSNGSWEGSGAGSK